MDDSAAAPGLAGLAALIADRARARMLMALMGGRSLTATELAGAARVTRQTASSHLARLVDARLAAGEQAGRHRSLPPRPAGRCPARRGGAGGPSPVLPARRSPRRVVDRAPGRARRPARRPARGAGAPPCRAPEGPRSGGPTT